MELIKNPNLNFMGIRKYGYLFSAALTLLSLVLILAKGPRLGVDFSGGAMIWVQFRDPLQVSDVRSALSGMGQTQATIQKLGGTNEFVIRSSSKQELNAFADAMIRQLAEHFPGNPLVLRSKETVEPKISRELTEKTNLAVLIALVLMGVYISLRFDFRFGTAAAVALIHTILIAIGALILTNREFTIPIVGALLTIVGYAINDTIVISDRVRENRKKLRNTPLIDIINTSINESFSRTILTGSAVIVTLFCLLFLGGAVIADFAFTLIVGFVFGTYATTFVVCALISDWELRFPQRRAKK